MCIKSGEDEQMVEPRAGGFGEKPLQDTNPVKVKTSEGNFQALQYLLHMVFIASKTLAIIFLLLKKITLNDWFCISDIWTIEKNILCEDKFLFFLVYFSKQVSFIWKTKTLRIQKNSSSLGEKKVWNVKGADFVLFTPKTNSEIILLSVLYFENAIIISNF